jgi:hypothetical protein
MYMSEQRVKSKEYGGVSLGRGEGTFAEMDGAELGGQGSFRCVI